MTPFTYTCIYGDFIRIRGPRANRSAETYMPFYTKEKEEVMVWTS